MEPINRLIIERACEALSIAYARHVDFGEYQLFARLFSPDGYLNAGSPLQGREAIYAAMSGRRAKLRSRHVLTNIYIDVIDDEHARGISYLTLYRHVGQESLAAGAIDFDAPAAVGHYSDEFVHTNEGWRIARRELEIAFRNPSKFPT